MSNDVLDTNSSKPIGWYERVIPIRGCSLSLEDISEVYSDLQAINREFGSKVISSLEREPDLTDEQWNERKAFLLNDAFRLTVTIKGFQDQQLYGESVEVFSDNNLPKPISTIFFTNATAYQRHSGGREPPNRIDVTLDFGKPELFDPNPLVSEATPNNSRAFIVSRDISFYNAVQRVIEKKIGKQRTWYSAIHRNFAYDIGMWFVALPMSLFFSVYYMDKVIPVGASLELFRWPLFVYFVGLALIVYRGLTAYIKWAFPVNVLRENKDRALRHRLFLGATASWLFYQFASTIYGMAIAG